MLNGTCERACGYGDYSRRVGKTGHIIISSIFFFTFIHRPLILFSLADYLFDFFFLFFFEREKNNP